ncbi:MAG: hypothetical protein IJT58_01515 [Synergistaceae bacterium]|nr:hypothetical protein [Synergistaceae bacterium]
MLLILSFVGVTFFLIGLYQWAQSGASIWRIFSIKRHEREDGLTSAERIQAEREVRQLEQSADRTLGASFKILAVLAVLTWLVLGLTMILDMFNIDWTGTLSARARSYWATPGVISPSSTSQGRNDMLRNLGSNLRR